MSYVLVDWSDLQHAFAVRDIDGKMRYRDTADQIIEVARSINPNVRVNERMAADKLVQVMAAAIFARVPLCNMAGKEITETPVPEANVTYITRGELGAILPDGWYIECQLNRYAACWGDAMTFPARTKLASAIADIQQFLAASIKQANDDLLASVSASRDLAEMEQLPMWLSSDSAKRAAETSAELDNISS